MTSTDGVQYSEDHNYWWDGSQWQPVDQNQAGQPPEAGQQPSGGTDAQQPSGGTDAQQQGEQPIDWSQYPSLWTLITSSDVNDYYQKLGIDPQKLMSSAESEGSEHQNEEQQA